MADFTHFNSHGEAIMVNVGEKKETVRKAVAEGRITMSGECFQKVMEGRLKKGDVLGAATVAGIMGAKRTSDLIPLCHILNLTNVEIRFFPEPDSCSFKAVCTAGTVGKTGVEMEALTGVTIALLTVYDMCKAVDKAMELSDIHLCEKSGGKSGSFVRPDTGRQP